MQDIPYFLLDRTASGMVSNTVEVKQLNVERVRKAIQRQKNCTKSGIAGETQLSIATCSTILNEMIESGEIVKVDQLDSVVGRPADLFAYNSDYQHVLCLCLDVDDGVITIMCAVADALGRVIRRENRSPKRLEYKDIEALVGEFLKDDERITAVGIGIPGVAQEGQIEFCEIKTLENVNLAGMLAKKYHLEILVENNMTFVIYYLNEKLPAQSGDLAAIFFPKGTDSCVGSGFMINGRVHHGATMMAGEVSYVARSFGLSQEKQQRMIENKKHFRQFASQMLVSIICTVNPKNAVFMGNDITQADLDEIYKCCSEVVHKRHIPKLSVDNDFAENYLNGVIRFLLDTVQYQHCMQ